MLYLLYWTVNLNTLSFYLLFIFQSKNFIGFDLFSLDKFFLNFRLNFLLNYCRLLLNFTDKAMFLYIFYYI